MMIMTVRLKVQILTMFLCLQNADPAAADVYSSDSEVNIATADDVFSQSDDSGKGQGE